MSEAGLTAPAKETPKSWLGTMSWAMFDWSAQPYYTIIGGFIFGPYIAEVVIGGENGMTAMGAALGVGGLLAALLSPVFGAIADRGGRRKPWLAGFTFAYVLFASLLWFSEPGPFMNMVFPLALIVLAGISVEFASVFTNAMLPDVVESKKVGRWSGYAYAMGFLGGLIATVLLIYFIIPPAEGVPGLPFAPEKPLLDLDPQRYEPTRAAAPLSALWFLVFIIPLFLFTPDRPSSGLPFRQAVREGFSMLWNTLRHLPKKGYRNLSLFLLSRMFFNDGLNALYVFGMIYAAQVLGWSDAERGLTGIILLIFAGLGAVFGGILDSRVGPKRTIMFGIGLLLIGTIGIISVGDDVVLFVIPAEPSNAGSFLTTKREWVLMISAALVGMGGGPTQSASRTMMTMLAPKNQMTEAFGLFALSGRVTAFLAPLAIAIVTYFADQRTSILSIAFFLVGGFLLLIPVKMIRIPDFTLGKK